MIVLLAMSTGILHGMKNPRRHGQEHYHDRPYGDSSWDVITPVYSTIYWGYLMKAKVPHFV